MPRPNPSRREPAPPDAEALRDALDRLREEGEPDPAAIGSRLHDLTAKFQEAPDRAAPRRLREVALPALVALYDARLPAALAGEPDGYSSERNDLLFVLKQFAGYGTAAGTDRVIAAARSALNDGFLWQMVFGAYTGGHPERGRLIRELADDPPANFAGVTFLDLCNAAAREDDLPGDLPGGAGHPFDTPAGRDRLRGYLADPGGESASYAVSAAAALPFLTDADDLFALAADHPDPGVRLEGAWAAAKQDREQGWKRLRGFCLDPAHAAVAATYLEELGRPELIPEAAREPDFLAKAEMAGWLAHPQEFGRPPDALEQIDARELRWPPTDDVREVRLFRYRYDADPEDSESEPDEGLGMVGSVTFALFGETTADLSPEDAYGLHCAWELEMNEDPRAPKQRTAAAGRKLLRAANPGGGF